MSNLLLAVAARAGHARGRVREPANDRLQGGATVGNQGYLSWLGPRMAAKMFENPTLARFTTCNVQYWILIEPPTTFRGSNPQAFVSITLALEWGVGDFRPTFSPR